MNRYSISRLKSFQRCARLYRHKYIDRRVPIRTSDALNFGKLWHEALERWWQYGMPATNEFLVRQLSDTMTDPKHVCLVQALLQNYNPPKDDYTVLGIEEDFEVPLEGVEDTYLIGRVDLVLQHQRTGKKYIVEHKTTSSEITGFGDYWQKLSIDHQLAAYVHALDADGVIYDVVRKPGLRMCKTDEKRAEKERIDVEQAYALRCAEAVAEDLEKYYQWREVHLRPDEIDDSLEDITLHALAIQRADNKGHYPRSPQSCRMYGRNCDYFEVCTAGADLDDPMWFTGRD